MISTVIIKPTKFCNASCTYCAAPPEVNGAPKWSLDEFKEIFHKIAPRLTQKAVLLWHGGEPMLMGPDFYKKAWEFVQSVKPGIRFSIQTNILGYSDRWRPVISEIFQGSVSTSYDPDANFREYKGSTELYTEIFYSRLNQMLDDGFFPKVIGTYTEDTIHLAHKMYEQSLGYGNKAFDLRFNYRYPAGRDDGNGQMITPESYGNTLVELYDRWIRDTPPFVITPLDEMLKSVLRIEFGRCPWTNSCGGRFLGIEPDGSTYNCSEFADLDDPEFCFGNIKTQTIDEILSSHAARNIRLRRVKLPQDCFSCSHFEECGGGCARDAVLYNHGLGGKFHYCKSWKIIFKRIKESILSGEADAAIRKYDIDPKLARRGLLAA